MTTRLPLVIVLTLVFASFVSAQSRAQSQKTIIDTEKKLWEAWKNKDMKPFRANLAADAIMISNGGVADKKTSLTAMEGEACEVTTYELSDLKVTFLNSSTAILTYKSTQDATCGGEKVPPAVWSSSVYVMRSGRWYAASHQETIAK